MIAERLKTKVCFGFCHQVFDFVINCKESERKEAKSMIS